MSATTMTAEVKSAARVKAKVAAQQTAQRNFDLRFLTWYVAFTANGHATSLWRKFNWLFNCYSLRRPQTQLCVFKLGHPWFSPSVPATPENEPCQQRRVTKMIISNCDDYAKAVFASDFADFLPLSRSGGQEMDRVEICKKLMLELDDCKEKVDLLELRHTLFRLYQFILLACQCINNRSHSTGAIKSIDSTDSTDSVELAESANSAALAHLLEYHKDLVKWMESVQPKEPTAEFLLAEEKKNEMLTVMKMTKPFIFEDLFRVIDLPTFISTFLSVTQLPLSSTSSVMPIALLSIVDEYCRLDPLNPTDEKLIAINLLKE